MEITLNKARDLASKILAAPDEEGLYRLAQEILEAREAAQTATQPTQPVQEINPNRILEELRRRVRTVLDKPRLYEDEAVALAEEVDILDAWLSAAGDLPDDWS